MGYVQEIVDKEIERLERIGDSEAGNIRDYQKIITASHDRITQIDQRLATLKKWKAERGALCD